MNTGIRVRSLLFAAALAALYGSFLQCQEGPNKNPINVTVSTLSLHPQEFDGHLVRVRAVLVFGWEGDNFMSDPNPESTPSNSPAYVWLYCKPEREQEVYGPIRPAERRSIHGWFTGYFHFVPKTHIVNGAFDPGPLQFEAVEVSIPEPQPRSLAEAIRQGDLEGVRRILRSGAKVNVWGEYRNPPLVEAISGAHADIAEELLAAGADPKLAGPDGNTSLMVAAWHCDLRIAKVLVDRGASVNAADVNGNTALTLASQTCPDGKMVQLLLDHAADPNAKVENGGTALMAAAGNPIVAEKLLNAGADPAVKNKYGNTVESQSCDRGEAGHFRVCELVKEALRKK